MSLIRKATTQDAFIIAANLQDADRMEIEGLGTDPVSALLMSISTADDPILFMTPDGIPAGLAGVSRHDTSGAIWMQTTTAVTKHPILFFKQSKQWLSQVRGYDCLFNIADPRNRLHMKLLHRLGFKRLGYRVVGPKSLTYVEFAKLCA
jgi:hypothetical protein